MIVIYADAIYCHCAVMVILDTAFVANWAMVHPGQFVDLTFLTKSPSFTHGWGLLVILHFHEIFGKVVIVKD
jgi:hypothetical protein